MPFNTDPSAIDHDDVRKPDMPMAVYHQEVNDLAVYLAKGDGWQRLFDVGLAVDASAALEIALPQSRRAQSEWYTARYPRKAEEQEALEQEAADLRTEAMAACRFNLRHDRGIQGTLDRIADGEGLADLAVDCDDLPKLIEANFEAFAHDKSFKAKEVADRLRELGPLITAGTSARRADTTLDTLGDARDRAFTVLDAIVTEIRECGRHAHRRTDQVLRFGSAYQRQNARSARRKKTKKEG